MENVFDGIKRAPANRLAREVASPGTHFDREYKRDPRDRPEPYPLKPAPNPVLIDVAAAIVGKRYGRMLVLGLSQDINARWVVRCSCGLFTLRRLAAIANPENNNDMCGECGYKAHCAAVQRATAQQRLPAKEDLPGMNKRGGAAGTGPNFIDQAELRKLIAQSTLTVRRNAAEKRAAKAVRREEQHALDRQAAMRSAQGHALGAALLKALK